MPLLSLLRLSLIHIVKRTFERLGVPEQERQFLAGVEAQYDSESAYSNLKEELRSQGVIFVNSTEGLKYHEDAVSYTQLADDVVAEYYGRVKIRIFHGVPGLDGRRQRFFQRDHQFRRTCLLYTSRCV